MHSLGAPLGNFIATVLALVLLVCSATAAHIEALPSIVGAAHRVQILSATRRNAIGADGAPAAFYFRRGADERRWLVLLDGGDWCDDDASCTQRAAATPQPPPLLAALDGIASAHPTNPLRDANLVLVPQVSHDAFLGNRTTASGVHLRGRAILMAVVDDALRGFTFNGSAARITLASQVVLAGTGTGALGALLNANRVAEKVAQHCPACSMSVIADGGLLVGRVDASATISATTPDDFGRLLAFWGAEAALDPACMRMMAANRAPASHCALGGALLSAIRVPTFVATWLYDELETRTLRLHGESAAMRAIAEVKRELLRRHAGFMPSCAGATMLTTIEALESARAGATTLDAALRQWLGDEGRSWNQMAHRDECSGINCSRDCPAAGLAASSGTSSSASFVRSAMERDGPLARSREMPPQPTQQRCSKPQHPRQVGASGLAVDRAAHEGHLAEGELHCNAPSH